MTGTHEEKVTLTLQVPDGYETTGDFRAPCKGEAYRTGSASMVNALGFSVHPDSLPVFILHRVLPDTLAVMLPRSWVKNVAAMMTGAYPSPEPVSLGTEEVLACRAALKAERQS